MTAFMQDVRYAVHTLRRSVGLTLVIVVSLAMGIGANTAIFSVVNALLLKPLPYPDPDRLAVLWLRSPGINIPQDWPSPGQYVDIQNENRSFEEMSISQGRVISLLGRGGDPPVHFDQPQRIEALFTSPSLFQLLGAKPLDGRVLRPEDDRPGEPFVVVLSHAIWTRIFNADPNIIGKTVTLNGVVDTYPVFITRRDVREAEVRNQFEVVGVLGPDFLLNDEIMPTVASLRRMDMFLPLQLGGGAVTQRKNENYNVMARLKPGVTMAQADADVAAIAGRIREKDRRDRTFTIDVVPILDYVVGNVRLAVLVLLGSVTMVLLIACANVANLLLTRAAGRQKEVAVRTALGANWKRIVRQLLTESLLLGIMGGAAGLLIAKAALSTVRVLNPGNIPRLDAVSLDGTVLAFTFGLSVLTGLVFGLTPALRAARVDLQTSLKAGGRHSSSEGGFGRSRRTLRSLLVVSEVALSLVLLIGAGLLVRSFVRLQKVSPGFVPDGVISMRVDSSAKLFQNGARVEFSTARRDVRRELGDEIASVPGVIRRGAVSVLPFTSAIGWTFLNVEGWVPQPGQELQVDQRAATPGYFETMGIPLVKGRFFTEFDLMPNALPAVVIDENFAKRFWPNGDALGKIVWNDPNQKMTIVGVVGVVKQYGLDVEPRIALYRPTSNAEYHVAKIASDPALAARAMARAIQATDPALTVLDVRTMTDRISDSLARRRFSTLILGAFAMFALILAVVGLYGLLSHLVAQGVHDIGVRMALGAERGRIVLMVLRQGMELAGAGVVTGLIGAAVLTRVMSSLLFGVSATDLMTFSTVPLILIATAILASVIPARRATRVDPVVALRDE